MIQTTQIRWLRASHGTDDDRALRMVANWHCVRDALSPEFMMTVRPGVRTGRVSTRIGHCTHSRARGEGRSAARSRPALTHASPLAAARDRMRLLLARARSPMRAVVARGQANEAREKVGHDDCRDVEENSLGISLFSLNGARPYGHPDLRTVCESVRCQCVGLGTQRE